MGRQDRPALQLAAAVREHVVFHGIHRRAAFVTDSEIRALSRRRARALVAQRDAYQEIFGEQIRAGIADGSLRASDADVATYAILLECTGVALWFDPRGPLSLDRVAELHVELVLGSVGALRGADRRSDRGGGRVTRVKPPALPEGATIAVVAPASPPQTRSEIEQATAYFEARGHEVVFGPNHRKVHGYLAGTDAERAADLQWALSEPGIDMVHTLCGGYGCARLYDLIDWDALGEPRIVCGFSDITALHLALAAHAGWVTFYGPNFLRFTRKKHELTVRTEAWFHRAFEPEPLGRVFEDPDDPYVLTVGEGVAEAPLVGGCITLLCASMGTPYEVQTEGCVVLVEDLNEDEYLVDTALNHLVRAGKLDRAAGLRLRHRRQPAFAGAPRGLGVDALDRAGARRADRPARDPGDRQRARRARQAHGDDAARGEGADRRSGEDGGGGGAGGRGAGAGGGGRANNEGDRG